MPVPVYRKVDHPYERFPKPRVLSSDGILMTGSTITPFLIVVIFGGMAGFSGFTLKLLNFGYRFFNLRPWAVSDFGVVPASLPSEIGSWCQKYSRRSIYLTGFVSVGLS